jgi:signal transduction histidine kinase
VTPPTNILLVDDEARNLDVLEGILQSADTQLVRADSAEAALHALLQSEFAVIVLDIQMPGMSGIELAELIKKRERTQHIPIIFLTAFDKDDPRMLQVYGLGAVDYLTKPVNPAVLRSKVAVFVDLHRKSDALRQSNRALGEMIAQKQAAERALQVSNDALEARVEARTTALREARDAAEQSGRAKDDFLAALSHELRTPLNPVLLLASEAAENPAFPAEARAQFLSIRKNAELEARLIDDLLDLTRITYGKLTLELGAHDLKRIVDDSLYTVREDVERKQITVQIEPGPSPQPVAADSVRLQQVFWNVLKNAVKFTPERGVIRVSTSIDPARGTVAVSVSDTGIGLSADEIDRIYTAFSQGDHATGGSPHRFGGLGLGLAISKRIIEEHGGRLYAMSPGPGQGATFVIELPLRRSAEAVPDAAPDARPAGVEPAKEDASAAHSRKLLLVEDHEATRTTMKRLLTRRRYDVAAASSLAEARALAAETDFDFLISDIGLPDGTGLELMRELQLHRKVRGIALTGYGMEEDIGRSRAAGFVVHLTKPIVIDALEKALAALHA